MGRRSSQPGLTVRLQKCVPAVSAGTQATICPLSTPLEVDGDALGVRQDVFLDGDGDVGQRMIP